MSAGWIINIAVAEWLIARAHSHRPVGPVAKGRPPAPESIRI
jgi:hypothetical protein